MKIIIFEYNRVFRSYDFTYDKLRFCCRDLPGCAGHIPVCPGAINGGR